MIVALTLRRNTKITSTTSAIASSSSNSTSEMEALMPVVRSVIVNVQRQSGANTISDHRGRLVHPRGLAGVLDSVDDFGDVGQHHRCAVAIGHDHAAIVIAGDQLIVGVDLVVLAR